MWSYEVIVLVSSHDSFRPNEYDGQLILATCFASTQLMRLHWCCLDNVMKRFRLLGMSSLQFTSMKLMLSDCFMYVQEEATVWGDY